MKPPSAAAAANHGTTGEVAMTSPLSSQTYTITLYHDVTEELNGKIEEITPAFVRILYSQYRSKKMARECVPTGSIIASYGKVGEAGSVVRIGRNAVYHTFTGRVAPLNNGKMLAVAEDGAQMVFDPLRASIMVILSREEVEEEERLASGGKPARSAPAAGRPAPAAPARGPAPAQAGPPRRGPAPTPGRGAPRKDEEWE